MLIVAGPPGGGKSSLFSLSHFAGHIFNADDRAAEFNGGSYEGIPLSVRAVVNREFEEFVHANISCGYLFFCTGDDAPEYDYFQNQVNLTVDATNGIAPVVFSFPARAWRTMTLPSVGGAWGCQTGLPEYGADGQTSGACLTDGGPTNFNSIGPLSGYHLTNFVGALAGVFLEDTLPSSAAPALRFYVSNKADGGIQTDFLTLSPRIGQVFFIGDGLTGTGTGHIQTFFVPPTATHLYLGYVDNCRAPNNTVPGCYSDNVGSLNATVRLQNWVPDWVQPTLSTAPSGRCCSGIAYDAAHYYTLLFGGGDAGQPNPNPQNDTWIWHNGWYKLSPATSPSPRNGPNLAYDPTTGTVVLFGGLDANGNDLNDTWTWDGVTWTQQFPRISPPARELDVPGMAYDAATGTVVLFGGISQTASLGDTWEWNGRTKTWRERFPAVSPSPRSTALAYDPLTGEILLFGGIDSTGTHLNDTWTWNGFIWTQRFPAASPSPRGIPSIAYDVSLGQVVLFGGRAPDGQSLDDTWGWNGSTWMQLKTYSLPPSRYMGAMDFDPLSNGLVLFAGWLQCCTPLDDTWLLIPVPVVP